VRGEPYRHTLLSPVAAAARAVFGANAGDREALGADAIKGEANYACRGDAEQAGKKNDDEEEGSVEVVDILGDFHTPHAQEEEEGDKELVVNCRALSWQSPSNRRTSLAVSSNDEEEEKELMHGTTLGAPVPSPPRSFSTCAWAAVENGDDGGGGGLSLDSEDSDSLSLDGKFGGDIILDVRQELSAIHPISGDGGGRYAAAEVEYGEGDCSIDADTACDSLGDQSHDPKPKNLEA